MALGARYAVRIEIIFVVRGRIARYRREVLPEIQPMLAVGLALVVLGRQLQLLAIVNVDGACAHHINTVGILRPVWVLSIITSLPLPSYQPP
jgi:hypothetical protein